MRTCICRTQNTCQGSKLTPSHASHVGAVQVLLEGGATLELQDALGRTALMFGAGSDATAACNVLLEAHASLSARDRRGRAALDYAPAGEGVAQCCLVSCVVFCIACCVLLSKQAVHSRGNAHGPFL
jgi:hypothetical protein